ncbi:MAG: glycosyltransferase family 4 protein [Bryobacteraceae bacterium]
MKILFVNRMLGIAWGGGENYDYNLASALSAQGHSVAFLGGRRRRTGSRVDGIETEWVETPYWRHWMYRLGGRIPLLPGMIAEADLHVFQRAAIERVRQWKREKGFDVLQVLGLPRLARAASAEGWPVALRFPGPPAWFQRRALEKLSARSGVGIFSHGDTVRRLRGDWGLPVHEVRPGIRTAVFGPVAEGERADARAARGWGRNDLVIASVGRMVPGKGHRFLIRAVAGLAGALPSARLVLAGDGPLRAQLETDAAASPAGGRIEFTGELRREQVARLLGAADLFALCSDYENFSNAVLEAMATGLPVIAPRLGGFPMQITDGINGRLYEPGSETGFQSACAALADGNARRAMSAGAREYASRFRWEASAEEATKLYERLLAH